MDLPLRNKSVTELQSLVIKLATSLVGVVIALLIVIGILVFRSERVLLETPGVPNPSIIEKTSLDKGSQKAVLLAVTNNLAQINPANYEYGKAFIEPYFSATDYTRLSEEMLQSVTKMRLDREQGSRYFVFKDYLYDPKINKHFVLGDIHFVNAAKDTAEPHVFEYRLTVENYRPLIVSLDRYTGTKPHNSVWVEEQKKREGQ